MQRKAVHIFPADFSGEVRKISRHHSIFKIDFAIAPSEKSYEGQKY
jgi:hypothetical protein